LRLHPQVEALRQQRVAAGLRPLYLLSVSEAREADLAAIRAEAARPEDVADVADRTIVGQAGEIPIRLYIPDHDRPLAVLVYLFGGGWVLGTIETSDAVCRRLARLTPCAVVAVGYRLAPEHKFPAAVEDCYAAVCWIAEHGDEFGLNPRMVAVGGDSAGGNLAAAVTLLARDRQFPRLCFQLLVYPATDFGADTESKRESTDPYFFNRDSVAWYWSHYLANDEDGLKPLASPLQAPDVHDLPPGLVITAEFDPLRDEGELYAERLRAAGVSIELVRFDGMVHGFFAMTGVIDAATDAQALAADRLSRAFLTPETGLLKDADEH
jgi:acetyl esterase